MQGFGGQPEYVSADGTLTNDSSLAVDFAINPTGQLEGAGGFISTDGNETSMTFEVSPTPRAISTFFSLVSNDTIARREDTLARKVLVWKNEAFVGGEAMFCVFGSILEVTFGGTSPPGCLEVILGAIPSGDVQPAPTSSSMTTVTPSSTSAGSVILTDTTTTTSNSPVPTSNSPSWTPTSEPISASIASQTSSLYLSPISSEHGNSATSSSMNPSTTMTQGAVSYSSTLASAPSPTSSEYPAPTTTGTPNCYDRSPFDGTVNNDYLILCDTNLPGSDLQRVPASNIAECIDECNSYIPSSQGPCVAVAFDIVSSIRSLPAQRISFVTDCVSSSHRKTPVLSNTISAMYPEAPIHSPKRRFWSISHTRRKLFSRRRIKLAPLHLLRARRLLQRHLHRIRHSARALWLLHVQSQAVGLQCQALHPQCQAPDLAV